ncbi:MAG: DUF4416 domain-containing protein [Deltaproteobacteria bacterium]|nr:MAG: DUF4416 domain-containing protein [Deltaproteobacteria bacterium]
MSTPQEAKKVKMISSLFSREEELIENVIAQMEMFFGPTDWISKNVIFNRTRYYEKEMGWPLYRRFISFSRLISPDSIVDIKLTTNKIENEHRFDKNRRINIDPGYISLERLVLATGKNYIHRIYLTKGIYADLTLVFHAGTFNPLVWTYPDYADETTISYFNMVRNNYLKRLREEGHER